MIERNHGLRFTFHVSRLPPPVSSTYSLVARDPAMGWLGSAVASRYFGVGAVVPHLRAGVGAWNTQHNHHHLLAMRGLDLLATGVDPDTALKMVLAGDPVPETRQLLVIDAQGRRAAWTGTACHEARGHLFGEHCIAAGNTLVSLRVVEALVEAFEGHLTEPFGRRLLLALEAAEAEGGDSRGKQSAAIRVVPALLSDWPSDVVDLRVDDHEEPLAELRRLYEKRWAGH
jgi:uncharacterized Ntn-hydrolase superfamily protein